MSRDIPTALQDAIDDQVVRPFLALRLELPDPVYVWTGSGTLTFPTPTERAAHGSALAGWVRSTR
jgi:hypothetical protein